MNIYVPTYLYIKQHSVTGLKYFGKTAKYDPLKYLGSGKHWKSHIKKHGTMHVVTLWYQLFDDKSLLTEFALLFSDHWDIVKSKEWANLIPENGIDGGVKGYPHSAQHNANVSAALKGISTGPCSDERKSKISAATKGVPKPPRTLEHNANISLAKKGKKQKPQSTEHNAAISAGKKGKKQPKVKCIYCNVYGGISPMNRYHFDKCKYKPNID